MRVQAFYIHRHEIYELLSVVESLGTVVFFMTYKSQSMNTKCNPFCIDFSDNLIVFK